MIYRVIDTADDKESRYWTLFMEEVNFICKKPASLNAIVADKTSVTDTYPTTRDLPFERGVDNW